MAWNTLTVTLWLVHFAETVGGKLATFADANFIANISYALSTVALLFSPCCAVVCRHGIQMLSLPLCAGLVRKKAVTLVNRVVALLQLWERKSTKFPDMSEIHPTI